ncbi:MAG: DUF1800 domain-containing protein [Bacteroidetes bacterium]|nr:DUF1800 domain-containing protein [Fibrella sp.]
MLTAPYAQPLTATQAAHLLRRATFGPTPTDIKAFTGLTAAQAVKQLLTEQPTPAPPLDITTGKTYNDLPFVQDGNGRFVTYNKSWWVGLMLNQPPSLLEKMTLFWSNHFAVNQQTVNDYRYMYQYNTLLRQQATGNFKAFVIAITQNPAMLRFLNGNANVVGRANENYGRELQELFTVGTGGGYTEEDVRTSARVLTGWADTGYRNATAGAVGSAFYPVRHDTADKTFSAAYQNTVIKGRSGADAGLAELTDLVDMLLRHPETARFICRRLYRWFINFDITPTVETDFIRPLAEVFVNSNFELKPVLTTLFSSTHFYDSSVQGAIIKSPVDLVVSTVRFFGTTAPDPASGVAAFYQLTNYLYTQTKDQQQNLLDPPDVFGWTAYYDTGYYQQWINSSTLGLRGSFIDAVTNRAVRINGKLLVDALPYLKTLANPGNAVSLVNDVTGALLAVPLTQAQKDFLANTILLNGLPDYEWTDQWNEYIADPGNVGKTMAIQMKINAFLGYLFRMAEYQVS